MGMPHRVFVGSDHKIQPAKPDVPNHENNNNSKPDYEPISWWDRFWHHPAEFNTNLPGGVSKKYLEWQRAGLLVAPGLDIVKYTLEGAALVAGAAAAAPLAIGWYGAVPAIEAIEMLQMETMFDIMSAITDFESVELGLPMLTL